MIYNSYFIIGNEYPQFLVNKYLFTSLILSDFWILSINLSNIYNPIFSILGNFHKGFLTAISGTQNKVSTIIDMNGYFYYVYSNNMNYHTSSSISLYKVDYNLQFLDSWIGIDTLQTQGDQYGLGKYHNYLKH